jgi:hypothetical protein
MKTFIPSQISRIPCGGFFRLLLTLALLAVPLAHGADFSGTVTDAGAGVEGVRITYNWTQKNVFGTVTGRGTGSVDTNSSGRWSHSSSKGLTTFVFSASQTGYTFSPGSRSSSTNAFGSGGSSSLNFTRNSSTISGTVSRVSVNVEGITISLTGTSTRTLVTDASGNYSFTKLPTGNYTIQPEFGTYVFSPTTIDIDFSSPTNRAGINFQLLTPIATTGLAGDVAFGKATLKGKVEGAAGLETTVWFEYGISHAFNLRTPAQIVPATTDAVMVAADVAGLQLGALYQFRLRAWNLNFNGESIGESRSFAMPYPEARTAIEFNGANQCVKVSANPILEVSKAISIEAWINPALLLGATGTGGIIVNREGEYEIARFDDGTIRYKVANTDPGWTSVNTGVVVPHNVWTHIAFTYDSEAADPQFRLHVNGNFEPDYTGNGSGLISDNASGDDFWIGGRQAGGQSFTGQIDEVRIWNRARTATEVADSFQKHLAGDEPGLLANFQFNDGSGNSTRYSGLNGLTGSLPNGATFVPSGAIMPEPVVSTLAPTPVLATRATFQGLVNPAGDGTVANFEYGETIAYGNATDGVDVGSGAENLPFSTVVENLQPGTTYHYRCVAFNSTGTRYGENRSFTTLVVGVGWPTTTKITGGTAESPRHVTDSAGALYVSGNFTGSATFKSTLVSQNDSPDAFVGKLGRGADWLWENQIVTGPGSSVAVESICFDSDRNVYVAGNFSGLITLGLHEGAPKLTAVGGFDGFLAKLGSNGTEWLWARTVGSDGEESLNAIAATPAGEVVVAGHYGGALSLGDSDLPAPEGRDILVAKLDADGFWIWATQAGGPGNDSASSLVLNSAGDAFLAGTIGGSVTFPIAGATPLVPPGTGTTDIFVARVGSDGAWLLARRAGGTENDTAHGLAIDSAGQLYLLGKFGGVADYNGTVTGLNGGIHSPPDRIFVAKLNPNANMLWYSQAGVGEAASIAIDPAGRIYIAGKFSVSSSFGSPPVISVVSGGNTDVFVARLESDSGDWTWAKKIGSSGEETAGSVSVDPQGGVTVSGTFQNTVQAGYVLLSTANVRDIFVARLDAGAVFEHNSYPIGQAIQVPLEAQDPSRADGGAFAQPVITILEKDHADSDALNSFVWSLAENKLYPVRPVTATFKWPLDSDPGNTTNIATAVGRSVWPDGPAVHIANSPVELEPAVAGFPLRFLNMPFTTIPGAQVDSASKSFTAGERGWSVIHFLDSGGQLPNPSIHPSRFDVVRTLRWNDAEAKLNDGLPASIGSALGNPQHQDPTGKNGYVFHPRAAYDGTGIDRAHDRATRGGPIIPVNRDTPAADDDLLVIWYLTSPETGVAWPSLPVRYFAQWPGVTDELVISSGMGSGTLSPSQFPDKRLYNQPDPALPGYNPNEEHAALYGDVLHALRNDLNDVISPKASDPYVLLKHRNPLSNEWTMKVFKVVTSNGQFPFDFDGEAGQLLFVPAPLSLLPITATQNTWVSGPGFRDHLGRLYARAAGPGGTAATVVARYWYPLQPGFYYDLDGIGGPDKALGEPVPWLDRRPGGTRDVPVDVAYQITWPDEVPFLQTGETLLGAKLGLPDLTNFAKAEVLYDEGGSTGNGTTDALTRLFDPLAPRVIQLRPGGSTDFLSGPGYGVFTTADADALFADLATTQDGAMITFTDLPYTLRSRLRYDPLNKNLIFSGLLDESQSYGGPDNPLLLLNVISDREADRIRELQAGNSEFADLITALQDLTRNPNLVDADGNGQPDPDLLIGFVNAADGSVVRESFGGGTKALSAGLAQGTGYVTLVENNDPSLGGLPVTLHVIRIDDAPYLGDIKVVQSDNVFDEKLSLRHSGDFAGEPGDFDFEWYYRPVEVGTDPTLFPSVNGEGSIDNLLGWTRYTSSPPAAAGLNEITLGDGGTLSLLILADNYFICRYRGYKVGGETPWSDWIGIIGGGQAQLAEGWVKRVRDGLNPFEARSGDFHKNETVTFASMLQQAGGRYEGAIAFNPDGGSINQIGLIEAYETVLRRARNLSVDAVPPVNYQPANDALLLAGGFIADLYFLLGNEATADAADPTIGIRSSSASYGTLAPSIFTFQNQLDSLLEEELALLRGRDDSAATVRLAPVYNRLFWNFTRDEGEVAYAQSYNITDQNGDGFINADDARIMFPQSHGDAWGHYLTATKTYYGLMRNPQFDWIPRSEPILLAGVPVNVDYLDERKFARAAAAKAKVGTEITDLTYRLNYVDDPAGQFQGYPDTNEERAWGVAEWSRRAGSAALFDWAVANAILPAVDPEPTHTGIEKIDRTTVPELDEIVAGFENVQNLIEKADAGLNPLGIAKNAVPFDIDPSLVSAGKTHFEQIYERAAEAMKNTLSVFDHANQLSQGLRGLQDSVNDFSRNVEEQERDYKNRMIEIFGYPYAGDIGTGKTYPHGYNGPDIYHYMYVNATEFTGAAAPTLPSFDAFFSGVEPGAGVFHFFEPDLATPAADIPNTLTVNFPRTTGDYGFTAPTSWGRRRAPGELQLALSDLLQSEARLNQAITNYDNLLKDIDDMIDLLEARYNLRASTIAVRNKAASWTIPLSVVAANGKATAAIMAGLKDRQNAVYEVLVETLPKSVGLATDAFAPARGALIGSRNAGKTVLSIAQGIGTAAAAIANASIDAINNKADRDIESLGYDFEIQQRLKELEALIREEPVQQAEVFNLAEKANQQAGRYEAAVAKGLRLAEERTAFRKNAAADTQQSRYQDMTFRIIRNEAIQKFRAQFDLTAQYVHMAAIAYDYETQLLGGQTGSGRKFLTDIVRQRALGVMINGQPVAGRHGLADPLARLNQNFGVLKGQLGFNNPQTETGRFSLRKELFRLRDTSDKEWRTELKKHVVANLWDLPEFRRHCRPFAPESAGPQPGLVLRFPTTVTFGLNYFGWPLGGGDSSYDSTLFATKVRSAGVWFSDYNGNGLSITPRVYLVPAGADMLRSPSGNNLETREWRVVDQKIPVPFPIGSSNLNDPTWIPMNDSLSDTFADIRRFSSFRAYHDSGTFDPAQTISDSRLIGRSVWNSDWMLIIPGGTFLFDSDEGLETFINTVSDIKIFYQTYAYSGN